VAENLAHMHDEETSNNAVLWATHGDEALAEIQQAIVASMRPETMAAFIRWMVPAMSPAERAAMLGEMQVQMPPEAMRAVLDVVRLHLDDTAWGKLARALRIPIALGLTA
jgi:hypothetical protein